MDTLDQQQISPADMTSVGKKLDVIPPQYKGMPSEVVEELWQNPVYVDEAMNESETIRRQIALSEIRKLEQCREVQKQEGLRRQYADLSDEQRTKFSDAQKDAAKILAAHIRGSGKVENLTPEESFVLGKIRADYEEYKKENPDRPFSFEFSMDIDRSVYNNLVQRLSLGILEDDGAIGDQEKANSAREELGVPVREIRRDKPALPEQKREGIEGNDYEEFRVKNGETDIGVFWYEYGNTAAKKLKESGKLEWGKERIYFDIALDDMEELRDMAFEVAKNEKIPIAFKHLDIQKTNQLDLKQDSDTTRFVANFASVEDAKRFYRALQERGEYQKMKSDRNMDYHGYALDGVAHYASGYREKREPLKRIIETAKRNPDNTYSYYSADGSKKLTITTEQYGNFKDQYDTIPDPQEIWKNAHC